MSWNWGPLYYPRPGLPKKPEFTATEGSFVFKGKDIPFTDCGHLFCSHTVHSLNGVYTGDTARLTVTDAGFDVICTHYYCFRTDREEDVEIAEACDLVRRYWGEYQLSVCEKRLARDYKLIFRALENKNNFVELTSRQVILSEVQTGGTIVFDSDVVEELHQGSIYVARKKQRLIIDMSKFADADVLRTFLHRFIFVEHHLVPHLNEIGKGCAS